MGRKGPEDAVDAEQRQEKREAEKERERERERGVIRHSLDGGCNKVAGNAQPLVRCSPAFVMG